MLGVIALLGMLKVTLPVPALTANPEPATALNTPMLPIVSLLMEMPVPAVSEVCAPGKVCPVANVTRPLLPIERPDPPRALLRVAESRLSVPWSEEPLPSACHRNCSFTALAPLKEEANRSNGFELNGDPEVAVPLAGNTAPAWVTMPLKLAVVPVRAPVRLAERPETEPVVLMFPVTLWLPLKLLAPVVA